MSAIHAVGDQILDEQKEFVTDVLTRNRHLVEGLRDALLERNELVGRELVEILDAASSGTVLDLREPVV